jgi:hypothetical protein
LPLPVENRPLAANGDGDGDEQTGHREQVAAVEVGFRVPPDSPPGTRTK